MCVCVCVWLRGWVGGRSGVGFPESTPRDRSHYALQSLLVASCGQPFGGFPGCTPRDKRDGAAGHLLPV